MVTLVLIIIFLLAGWITLIVPLSDSNTIQITFSVIVGLVAVNISGISMIIHKLDMLKIKSNEKGSQEDRKTDN